MKKFILWIMTVSLLGFVGVKVYDFAMPRLIVHVLLEEVQSISTSHVSEVVFDSFEAHEKELATLVLSEMSFDVLNFDVLENGVISTVSIENINIEKLLKENVTTLVGYTLSDLKETLLDVKNGGVLQASINKISMLLQDVEVSKPRLKTTIQLHLVKEDGQWKPCIDQALINAILGLSEPL